MQQQTNAPRRNVHPVTQQSAVAQRIGLIAFLKEKYKEMHKKLDKSYDSYISYINTCTNAELTALAKDAA